jgi:hypothetical protein
MSPLRRRIWALSGAIVAAALAAAPSGASAQVPGGIAQGGQANAAGRCIGANAPSGIGDAGQTFNRACGAGVVFFGTSIGQIGTVVGPTIMASTVASPITSSLGPVTTGWLP